MFYTNFDAHITAKWHIVCDNWPLPRFCNPGDLTSRNEVQVLYNAWQSGATHFRKLDLESFSRWEAARFQVALSQTMGESQWAVYGGDGAEAGNTTTDIQMSSEPSTWNILSSTPTSTSPPFPTPTFVFPSPSIPASSTSTANGGVHTNDYYTGHDATRSVSPVATPLTSLQGQPMPIMKKKRKPRSDKGVSRGPRRKV